MNRQQKDIEEKFDELDEAYRNAFMRWLRIRRIPVNKQQREIEKKIDELNEAYRNAPPRVVFGPKPPSKFETFWWNALTVAFFVVVAGAIIWFLWAAGSGIQAAYEEGQRWEQSCVSQGGVVVDQYRAPTWCVVDGEIVSTHR